MGSASTRPCAAPADPGARPDAGPAPRYARRMGVGRRRIALVVRSLCWPRWSRTRWVQLVLPVDALATVFVVDLSDSLGKGGSDAPWRSSRDRSRRSRRRRRGHRRLRQERPRRADADRVDEIDRPDRSTPVKTATDIGAALRLASALFPDDAQKRIVLLSDGNDTTGGGRPRPPSPPNAGSDRDPPDRPRLDGRGARRATDEPVDRPPRRIGPGDGRDPLLVAQTATVRLFADGTLVKTQPVELVGRPHAGRVRPHPAEAGSTFRAVVEAGRDTFSQNDRADSNTIVKGEPRTLVLVGDDDVAAELVAASRNSASRYTMVPEAFPTDFASLATYDSIVLVDVPRLRLNDRQLAALQVYVRDLGQGLVMVGGPPKLWRRRLPEDRRWRKRSRSIWASAIPEAARHRPRRRHRPVRIHGRLPLQRVRHGVGGGTGSAASRRSTSARRPSCGPRPR